MTSLRRIHVPSLEHEYRSTVSSLFGDQLCFAFIFGGFGKGYGGPGHDIDMFIVLNRIDTAARHQFESWYFELHERLDLPPDDKYPGEVVLFDDLSERVTFLETRNIRPVIESMYEYEAILWVDALSERKIGLVQGRATSVREMEDIHRRAGRLRDRWRREISNMRPESGAELASLDLRRLFKGYVQYLKLPGESQPDPL